MTLYCVCGEPVMNPAVDAGCRRCGRPVDFTPHPPFTAGVGDGPESRAAPVVPGLIACNPDESAGLEEQYLEELRAGRDPRD